MLAWQGLCSDRCALGLRLAGVAVFGAVGAVLRGRWMRRTCAAVISRGVLQMPRAISDRVTVSNPGPWQDDVVPA
eukprot:13870588-Alexandrium_andersonii.AAC.1